MNAAEINPFSPISIAVMWGMIQGQEGVSTSKLPQASAVADRVGHTIHSAQCHKLH